MRDFDLVERHTEHVRDNLRKGRFVTLAMAVGARENGDVAGGVHPHFA